MTGRKKIIILLLAVSLMVIPFGSSAVAKSLKYPIENSAELMAADLVVARPLQFVSLVTGTVVFVISLPFSALGKNVGEAYNLMMVEPARMTFLRPLGVF
ncbi:MAG: multidrug transporter [Desulfobacteraceae bacterium]|nr:multidrug transporter [Desulfobacteraceae bacterium]MBC2754677.1 multidrug transporter [Desulfobacteraceae bacterium]